MTIFGLVLGVEEEKKWREVSVMLGMVYLGFGQQCSFRRVEDDEEVSRSRGLGLPVSFDAFP